MFFGKFRHLTSFRGFSTARISNGESPRVSTDTQYSVRQRIYYSFQKLGRGTGIRNHGLVVTLDPKMFVAKNQQCFSIGNVMYFNPPLILHKQRVIIPRLIYSRYQLLGRPHYRLFPPDTKASLYYTTSPGKPRIAGELRLRVLPSGDPASFASGSDLLLANGQPWSRPLHVLPRYYTAVYEKLREERLIPDDLHAALSAIPKPFPARPANRFFYTLHDTFIIDFSIYSQHSWVITEKGMEMLPCPRLFFDGRVTYKRSPYQGT